jgi:hypothetical protein
MQVEKLYIVYKCRKKSFESREKMQYTQTLSYPVCYGNEEGMSFSDIDHYAMIRTLVAIIFNKVKVK